MHSFAQVDSPPRRPAHERHDNQQQQRQRGAKGNALGAVAAAAATGDGASGSADDDGDATQGGLAADALREYVALRARVLARHTASLGADWTWSSRRARGATGAIAAAAPLPPPPAVAAAAALEGLFASSLIISVSLDPARAALAGSSMGGSAALLATLVPEQSRVIDLYAASSSSSSPPSCWSDADDGAAAPPPAWTGSPQGLPLLHQHRHPRQPRHRHRTRSAAAAGNSAAGAGAGDSAAAAAASAAADAADAAADAAFLRMSALRRRPPTEAGAAAAAAAATLATACPAPVFLPTAASFDRALMGAPAAAFACSAASAASAASAPSPTALPSSPSSSLDLGGERAEEGEHAAARPLLPSPLAPGTCHSLARRTALGQFSASRNPLFRRGRQGREEEDGSDGGDEDEDDDADEEGGGSSSSGGTISSGGSCPGGSSPCAPGGTPPWRNPLFERRRPDGDAHAGPAASFSPRSGIPAVSSAVKHRQRPYRLTPFAVPCGQSLQQQKQLDAPGSRSASSSPPPQASPLLPLPPAPHFCFAVVAATPDADANSDAAPAVVLGAFLSPPQPAGPRSLPPCATAAPQQPRPQPAASSPGAADARAARRTARRARLERLRSPLARLRADLGTVAGELDLAGRGVVVVGPRQPEQRQQERLQQERQQHERQAPDDDEGADEEAAPLPPGRRSSPQACDSGGPWTPDSCASSGLMSAVLAAVAPTPPPTIGFCAAATGSGPLAPGLASGPLARRRHRWGAVVWPIATAPAPRPPLFCSEGRDENNDDDSDGDDDDDDAGSCDRCWASSPGRWRFA